MQNRIKHLEMNNDHIMKKTEYMDRKKEDYLERRKDKLLRDKILDDHRRKEVEEIRRKQKNHNPFFLEGKEKNRTNKELKNTELAKIREESLLEKDLIQNLTAKQFEFNKQKNEQKILMSKIDKIAKATKKAEQGRSKYNKKKEESRNQLIQTQHQNEELRAI